MALIIFGKEPRPGRVKTRLGEELGFQKAALIYKAFLQDLLDKHGDESYNTFFGIEGDRAYFEELCGVGYCFSQWGANLGQRMANAFKSFLGGYEKVVLIGSDIPNLSEFLVYQAFEILNEKDLVLGPSRDGGYYLIGMKRYSDIFSEIPCSTNEVFARTMEKAKNLALSVGILPEMRDIDTLEDLKAFRRSVRKQEAPNTFGVLSGLEEEFARENVDGATGKNSHGKSQRV